MKVFSPLVIASVLLGVYLVLSLTVFPTIYLAKEVSTPQPFFDVNISKSSITLGESFDVNVSSQNIGDYGDIHILSVGFPSLEKINDEVRVLYSDFNHQPHFIEKNTLLGSNYTGGDQKIESKYAIIEIMNRPSPQKDHYTFHFEVTPKSPGPFEIYVKTIEIPHTSELSHFPRQGLLDPQNEYVTVYSVMVNP